MKNLSRVIEIFVITAISTTVLLCLFVRSSAQIQEKKLNDVKMTSNSFQLSAQIKNENTSVKIEEAVPFVLTVANNTDVVLHIVESYTARDFEFSVENEFGKVVPLTKDGRRLTEGASVWRNKSVKFEPGKSKQYEINLAHIYDMSAKGTYFIRASRWARKTNGERIEAKSNLIRVVVE